MEAVDWYSSKEVLDSWKAGFRDIKPPFDGQRVSPKREDANLWAYFNNPYPEIRLIAFAFNPTLTTPRVMCRVWIYKDSAALREKLLAHPLVSLINEKVHLISNPKPGASWQRRLEAEGVEVVGIQFDVECPEVFPVPAKGKERLALQRLEDGLTDLGDEFLAWVDRAYHGEAEAPKEQAPVESPAWMLGEDSEPLRHPEEVSSTETYLEGAVTEVLVNVYERNPKAREACIKHYGTDCQACGLNFEQVYGAFAAGFIHVHHQKPLHAIGASYEVDPINDLIPLCPSCHSVVHLTNPPMSVAELKALLQERAIALDGTGK